MMRAEEMALIQDFNRGKKMVEHWISLGFTANWIREKNINKTKGEEKSFYS